MLWRGRSSPIHSFRSTTPAAEPGRGLLPGVASPYQLIVVGDPLCRPWASIPNVTVEGAASGATLKGTAILRPSGDSDGKAAGSLRAVRQRRASRALRHGRHLEFDAKFPDGDAERLAHRRIETSRRSRRKEGSSCRSKSTITIARSSVLYRSRKGDLEGAIQVVGQIGRAVKIVFRGMRTLGNRQQATRAKSRSSRSESGWAPSPSGRKAQFSEDPKDAVISQADHINDLPEPELPPRKLRAGIKLSAGLQFKSENGPFRDSPDQRG